MTLNGKTVFITGTNRGLGKSFAEAFAAYGANVIAHARRDSPDFRAFLDGLAQKNGVTVTPVFFDMTDSAAMKAAVRAIVAAKTPVNVLVNSAGVAHGGLFQMTSMENIREVFAVNLFAHMELTQQLM